MIAIAQGHAIKVDRIVAAGVARTTVTDIDEARVTAPVTSARPVRARALTEVASAQTPIRKTLLSEAALPRTNQVGTETGSRHVTPTWNRGTNATRDDRNPELRPRDAPEARHVTATTIAHVVAHVMRHTHVTVTTIEADVRAERSLVITTRVTAVASVTTEAIATTTHVTATATTHEDVTATKMAIALVTREKLATVREIITTLARSDVKVDRGTSDPTEQLRFVFQRSPLNCVGLSIFNTKLFHFVKFVPGSR